MPPSKPKPPERRVRPADLTKRADVPKAAGRTPKSSGVKLVAVRVADFRSLTNIEVVLDDLTVLVGANNAGKTSLLEAVQFAIGANRRLLGKEDIRLAKDEADVPKERRAVVDILLRPVSGDGKIVETFPDGSFWTGLWGTGIAQNDGRCAIRGRWPTQSWAGDDARPRRRRDQVAGRHEQAIPIDCG
jgi:hypothetical protein